MVYLEFHAPVIIRRGAPVCAPNFPASVCAPDLSTWRARGSAPTTVTATSWGLKSSRPRSASPTPAPWSTPSPASSKTRSVSPNRHTRSSLPHSYFVIPNLEMPQPPAPSPQPRSFLTFPNSGFSSILPPPAPGAFHVPDASFSHQPRQKRPSKASFGKDASH